MLKDSNQPGDDSQNAPCTDVHRQKPGRLWVVTELYYPDDGATGHLLTQIAEGLADDVTVHVLTAQPGYAQKRELAPRAETLNGVHIRRCRSTRFSKDHMPLRLINVLTIMISFLWNMIWRFRKSDEVLVVTNPPTLPIAALMACRIRRSGCTLLVHDIYPDVLVPTGFTKKNSIPYRLIDFFSRRLFCGVHRIITIGRDMRERVIAKSESLKSKTSVIANWCDHERVYPVPRNDNPVMQQLGLADKFVVLYSGNVGRTHGLETIAGAAKILEESGQVDIHWLVCGAGGGRAAFEQKCQQLELSSVTVHDFFPRDQLHYSLSCGDVAIIPFIPGMAGISVPSRMYNFFAAGQPVIGVTEPDSELALTLTENRIGWVVRPDNAQQLADLVQQIYTGHNQLPEMSKRCREVAVETYSRERALAQYREVLLGEKDCSDSNAS